MRSLVVLLVAGLVAGGLLAGAGQAIGTTLVLAGYDPEGESTALLAIKAAGGNVRRTSPEIGVALVETNDPENFRRVVLLSGAVDYVEDVDPTFMSGSQWNGAQWNGAQWNGGQWNGGQWNGGQWNGGQWNGGQWNGGSAGGPSDVSDAQREALRWTLLNAVENWPRGWSYDPASSDPGLVWQWGAWAIGAPAAGMLATGSHATSVCVLDTGVAWDHPDVAPNFGAAWNAIVPTSSAYDDAGHGTHVAGLAAAATGNAFGVAGVGNARILAVKVLDANGAGAESDLLFGIVWCALQGADVAVMALSVTEGGPSMERALAFAASRDVLLLASAGNVAGVLAYPASDPHVVAVGAVDGGHAAAPFSGAGLDLELVAPGVHALGPFPPAAFAFGSGTSQAVGIAAGVATLVRDAAPALRAADVRLVLQESARDLGAPGRDAVYGFGLVAADQALARAGVS